MKRFLLAVCFLAGMGVCEAQAKPKLVVNIVVSQLKVDALRHYRDNFGPRGFRRFAAEGSEFTDFQYGYAQTGSVAGLATLATGANPSTHGIVGESWVDYLTDRMVHMADDPKARGLDCDEGVGQYSPVNLTVPTLGDALLAHNPQSKVVTVAADPASAVAMGGWTKSVFWMDQTRGTWATSTVYQKKLPQWVVSYNEQRPLAQYLNYHWQTINPTGSYLNQNSTVVEMTRENGLQKLLLRDNGKHTTGDYANILFTPAGNSAVKEFAKQALVYEDLGVDDHVDLLNICFDASRYVTSRYGFNSTEAEDMLYRLDFDLAELIDFIRIQRGEDVVVVITSDHGAGEAQAPGNATGLFSGSQFRVIVEGLLNSKYGSGDWVTGYAERNLYLNRTLINRNNLSLEQIQNQIAAFALQFEGITHVATATALSNGSFHSGWGAKASQGFYAKRSGDIVINLAPGWIEQQENVKAMSGSGFRYDTHVPLFIFGQGIRIQKIDTPQDATSLAPALARIMGIDPPVGSTGPALQMD